MELVPPQRYLDLDLPPDRIRNSSQFTGVSFSLVAVVFGRPTHDSVGAALSVEILESLFGAFPALEFAFERECLGHVCAFLGSDQFKR